MSLGFSIEENFSYAARALGSPVLMNRFLTANFLHMFLTAFICYSLTIAVQRGGRAWEEFAVSFAKMVLAHGVYDFLLVDPQMQKGGFYFFALMILLWLAMQYIRLILSCAPPRHRSVSLTRVFTIVLCVAIGISYVLLSDVIGMQYAMKAIFAGVLSNAIFAYMFFKEFNDPIGH